MAEHTFGLFRFPTLKGRGNGERRLNSRAAVTLARAFMAV